MNKLAAVIAVLIGGLSVMGGCSKDPAKDQVKVEQKTPVVVQVNEKVQADLTKYSSTVSQALKPLSVLDQMTEDLGKIQNSKAYVAKLKKEFLPLVTTAITKMEAIKPATKEVQDIHGAYLASIKEYAAGLKDMATAVEKKDDKLVSASEARINALIPAHQKFVKETTELAEKNNVKLQ